MALIDFDSTQYQPNEGLNPVPAGKYNVVIAASEVKETKNGNGRFLQLEFEIIDGEYKGRKVWTRINLWNPNKDAVRIAQGDMTAICRAVNVLHPKDSVELHNLPLCIKVALKPNQNGELQNEIPIGGYEPKMTAQAMAAPAGADGKQAPWAKKQ
jgi:hypothetical protein